MKGVTKIGYRAFQSVGASYFEENGKIIYSTIYIWNSKKNEWETNSKGIKYSVDSYPTIEFSPNLKIIDHQAFIYSGFRSIKLPEGLESINAAAFRSTQFENIDFQSSLKVIGAYAFDESKLKEVKLNEGLEFLGLAAFNDCKELTSVSLPASLKYVTHFMESYIFESDKISK